MIRPMDQPDFEIVTVPAEVLAARPDAKCNALGCCATASHCARSVAAGLACWLCAVHAQRIISIRAKGMS